MQDIYISIGQNIRRRRKEKHLTQESLAANVETSAQYISRIERGQVCPSLEFLYRLWCNSYFSSTMPSPHHSKPHSHN